MAELAKRSEGTSPPAAEPDLLATVAALRAELAAVKAQFQVTQGGGPGAAERRQTPRVPVMVTVHVLTGRHPEMAIIGEVVDLSRVGFALIVDALFVVDSYLKISSVRDSSRLSLEARVRSRTPLEGSVVRWRIGCEFVRQLRGDELAIFFEPETPNPSPS